MRVKDSSPQFADWFYGRQLSAHMALGKAPEQFQQHNLCCKHYIMANTTSNIKDSWALMAFATMHDSKMAVVECTNSETGEIFHACAFGKDNDSRVFCSFSPKIGEMTPAEIVAQKDDLQVVEWETEDKHGFTLCKKGNSDKWQEVNLF